jgi:hypothetical protein
MRAPRKLLTRRAAKLALGWLFACVLIGCNLILGSESAVFDPSAAADAAGDESTSLVDATTSDRTASEAGDAGSDAGPCIDTDTNPRHCGKCGHDCLGGKCVAAVCQPYVVATEPGSFVGIALDPAFVYWTNPATGDVRRAPIGGGTAQTVFDGPPGTSLGEGLVRSGNYVYFAINEQDGGVYRCPPSGCTTTGPEKVVAPVDSPQSIAVDDAGTIYVLEATFNGRVGRCAPPCAAGLDVIATGEGFPEFVAGQGDSLYWSTITPAPGGIRGRPAGAAAPRTLYSAPVRDVTIAGSEVFFVELGVGPRAMSLDGGTVRRISDTSTQTQRLTVSDGVVYFNDSVSGNDGRIFGCAAAGCGDAGALIASGQLVPHALAADAVSIYWTNLGENDAGAAVMRVAK